MSTPEYASWCRRHFALMRDGAVWAVPRSGLIFRKQAGGLVLAARMPWRDVLAAAAAAGLDVPADEAALRVYQAADFALIRDEFERAGIEVRDDEQEVDR